jgi:GNAT superfamily N-acetyltransferase
MSDLRAEIHIALRSGLRVELSAGPAAVTVRGLEPADERAVLEVFTAAEDWFVAETGEPSAPGDVQSSFYALPEGAAFDDKVLLVIEIEGAVAGYIDAVLHYPHPTAVAVGTFLLRPEARRRGVGRAVAETLSALTAAAGFTQVSTHVAEDWEPGHRFLGALGYTFSTPRYAAAGTHKPGPHDRPVIPATGATGATD